MLWQNKVTVDAACGVKARRKTVLNAGGLVRPDVGRQKIVQRLGNVFVWNGINGAQEIGGLRFCVHARICAAGALQRDVGAKEFF